MEFPTSTVPPSNMEFDTSLNRSQSAISEQSDDHKGKKRKKNEEDEDFVMDDDEPEEEEAIEVSDEALSDAISSNDELEMRPTRSRKKPKFIVDDDEELEETETPKENGKDIKKRLRPRTQAQLNPYSHPIPNIDNIEIPSKSTMIKEQQELLAPLDSLTFQFSESESESDNDETGLVNPAFGKKGEYDHIKPINIEQLKKKPSADIDPVFSKPVGFDMVGGLHKHINALKEMVVLPLLYPEVFNKFDITPPRGVIFYGPPGTVSFEIRYIVILTTNFRVKHLLLELLLAPVVLEQMETNLLPSLCVKVLISSVNGLVKLKNN